MQIRLSPLAHHCARCTPWKSAIITRQSACKWHDRRGSWEPEAGDVVATGDVLNGAAWYVQDARKADVFVVKARTPAGIGFYAVEAAAQGVTIVPDAIVDLTRDQAHVELRDVAAVCVAAPGSGAGSAAIVQASSRASIGPVSGGGRRAT